MIPRKSIAFPVSAVAVWLLLGAGQGGSRGPALDGEVIVTLRGSGAAPFGIGAAVIGGTNFAYNLGRLQQLAPPQEPLAADQSYGGALHFTLVPRSTERWVLSELTLDYEFVNRTRFTYEESEIVDRMNDAGWVGWTEGRWHGPAGWDPGTDPRIELEIFRQPTAAACSEPGGDSLWRRTKARFVDTSDWVDCYRLEFSVPQPARPTGESHWTSPIGEVRVEAREGDLRFSGEAALLPQAIEMFESLPDPAGAKRFAQPGVELAKAAQAYFEQGMAAEVVPVGGDWGLEGSFRGALAAEGVRIDEIHRILTGALLRERIRVDFAQFVLEKTPERWRPVAEATGSSKPEVKIRGRSTGSEPQPVRWRFTLFDVSREKGRYLNDQGSDTELDLVVRGEDNPAWQEPEKTGDGFRIETKEGVTEAVLTVRATDYGAWGRLKAEVELEPDRWQAVPVQGAEEDSITIPRDEAGGKANYIADSWERRHEVGPGWAPILDAEKEPAPSNPGDGLTLYEEYRGFSVDGTWTDLDPKKKDLFLNFTPGTRAVRYYKLLEQKTGLRVRLIRANEFVNPGTRVVNPNRGEYSVAEQHGLYISEWFHSADDPDTLPDGVAGIAHGGPDTPGGVWLIALSNTDSNPRITFVHEVMHGVNVWHHGGGDFEVPSCYRADTEGNYAIEQAECELLDDGDWWTGLLATVIAARGGQHSGDQFCVMTYRGANGFADQDGKPAVTADKRFIPFRGPEIKDPNFHLCTTLEGTGDNADDAQAGDPARDRGACLYRIEVSDG